MTCAANFRDTTLDNDDQTPAEKLHGALMDWITTHVALGDIDDAVHIEILRKVGVTAILCLNGFPSFPRYEGFVWHSVELIDGPGNEPSALVRAIDTIAALVSQGHKVLVHCAYGTSRSPFVVTCYLETFERLEMTQAMDLVMAKRPFTLIHEALLDLRRSMQLPGGLPGMYGGNHKAGTQQEP